MGTTKTMLFTTQQNEIAQLAKAIAHPARIAIIQHLIAVNACVCNDMVAITGLAQSTVSQHLKELKGLGLVKETSNNGKSCYCINASRWTYFKETMQPLLESASIVSTTC